MTIELPENVRCEISGGRVKIAGANGEIQKFFVLGKLKLKQENGKLILEAQKATRREKTMAGTINAIIKNMIKGVTGGFVYKLQICSSHFPMTVKAEGNEIIIKNFLGERTLRKSKILPGVNVKVQGDIISVTGSNNESIGQTCRNIELSTIKRGKDIRVFQDGIYLIERDGVSI